MSDADRPVVERLWELYSHDMSEVLGPVPRRDGTFKPGRLPTYFGSSECRGFPISLDDAPVGFAFIQGGLGRDEDVPHDHFVLFDVQD